MSNFLRFAATTALMVSLGGVAHAQSQPRPSQTAPDRYEALSEGRSNFIDRTASTPGVTPPSESQTVMGLRVPH